MPHYSINQRFLVQDVVSETVLLDMNKGDYFQLNEMGSVMLKRLADLGDPEKVIASLLQDYEVSREELSRDLDELIQKMVTYGVIGK